MTRNQHFVSLDGADSNGVRAEVHVETGIGKIVSIEPSEKGNSSRITVKNNNPQIKRPIGGYINPGDPLYTKIEEAHAQGRDIAYRVESQRRKNIDRTTPISELRKTMELGAKNTVRIFAALDGDLSQEAVTDPNEDPQDDTGRIRAVDQNKKKAEEPPAPVEPQQNNSSVMSYGAPPFREHNFDGSLNLGNYAIGQVLQLDTLVRKAVAEAGLDDDRDDDVTNGVRLLSNVADKVYLSLLEGHSKVERMSALYSRVIGLLIADQDIRRFHPAPWTGDVDPEEWSAETAARLSERYRQTVQILYPQEFAQPLSFFPPVLQEEGDTRPRASDKTRADLQELTKAAGIENLEHLKALLQKTFGVPSGLKVADEDLAEFVSFYANSGLDNFAKVAAYAYSRLSA